MAKYMHNEAKSKDAPYRISVHQYSCLIKKQTKILKVALKLSRDIGMFEKAEKQVMTSQYFDPFVMEMEGIH